MRLIVKQFVETCARNLPIEDPVVEFGSYQVKGQEGFADLRPYFQGRNYVGCDLVPGPGVDRIDNVEETTFESGSIGLVIFCDTIEHVGNFHKAIREIERILSPTGALIMTSVMNFGIHEFPKDYWRFTPDGFRYLLDCFPVKIVHHVGHDLHPHTIAGVGIKGDPGIADQLGQHLVRWRDHWQKL